MHILSFIRENTRCEGHKLPEQDEFPMIWRDFEEKGHYAGERPEKVGNSTVEVYVWVLMIPVSYLNIVLQSLEGFFLSIMLIS